MEIKIIAVGKAKSSPALDLFNYYTKRTPWKISVKEVDEKRKLASAQLKKREAELLLDQITNNSFVIALDERGRSISSIKFANVISDVQSQGISNINFIIGGADGLDDSVRKRANQLLSFGAMTWPHMLVRGMLAEQLYRAHTIITNHPYHKV